MGVSERYQEAAPSTTIVISGAPGTQPFLQMADEAEGNQSCTDTRAPRHHKDLQETDIANTMKKSIKASELHGAPVSLASPVLLPAAS